MRRALYCAAVYRVALVMNDSFDEVKVRVNACGKVPLHAHHGDGRRWKRA